MSNQFAASMQHADAGACNSAHIVNVCSFRQAQQSVTGGTCEAVSHMP